jgi:hypothetical protein
LICLDELFGTQRNPETMQNNPNFDNGFSAKELVKKAKNEMDIMANDESSDDDEEISDSD